MSSETQNCDVYEVFARVKLDEPLAHLGCVHAPNEDMAIAEARMTYSEKPWTEMAVVYQPNILPVIRQDNAQGRVGFA